VRHLKSGREWGRKEAWDILKVATPFPLGWVHLTRPIIPHIIAMTAGGRINAPLWGWGGTTCGQLTPREKYERNQIGR